MAGTDKAIEQGKNILSFILDCLECYPHTATQLARKRGVVIQAIKIHLDNLKKQKKIYPVKMKKGKEIYYAKNYYKEICGCEDISKKHLKFYHTCLFFSNLILKYL